MLKVIVAPFVLSLMLTPAWADHPASARSGFWSGLDHNGPLSAGWVQVLPVLATACNLRLDNRELNAKLVDLSRASGNVSYTRDLYYTLYKIENRETVNRFVSAWMAKFNGKQKQACETAEALWGESGNQFPGVLKREASNDQLSAAPPNGSTNCR